MKEDNTQPVMKEEDNTVTVMIENDDDYSEHILNLDFKVIIALHVIDCHAKYIKAQSFFCFLIGPSPFFFPPLPSSPYPHNTSLLILFSFLIYSLSFLLTLVPSLLLNSSP